MAATKTKGPDAETTHDMRLPLTMRIKNVFRYKIRLNAILGRKQTDEEEAEPPAKGKEKKAKVKKEKKEKKEKKPKEKKPKQPKPKKEKKAKPAKAKKEKPAKEAKEKSGGGKALVIVAIVCALLGISGVAYGGIILYQETNSIDRLMEKAASYQVDGDYENAIGSYNKILAMEEDNVRAYMRLADTHLAADETKEQAIAVLEKGVELTGDASLEERLELLLRADEEEEDAIVISPIIWMDTALEAAVRRAMDRPTGDIYPADVETVRTLEIFGNSHAVADDSIRPLNTEDGYYIDGVLYSQYGEIRRLDDLAHFKGLRRLIIAYNHVQDVGGLSKLEKLNNLSLYCNDLEDITPLSSISTLQYLYLYRNGITDLSPLASLKELRTLWVQHNRITDLSPVSGMTNLLQLFVGNNRVSDISPVSGLQNLTALYAQSNDITDITPAASLSALTDVSFENNPVSDYGPVSHVNNVNGSFTGVNLDQLRSAAGSATAPQEPPPEAED